MANKPKRIIVDTNLWISFLISKNFDQFEQLIYNRKVVLLFSRELIEEFIAVVSRPKFKRYFSKDDINELFTIMNKFSEVIKVKHKVDACRDKKDNFLLELARSGNANFLITGDKDLLSMKEFYGTKMITMNEFLRR